MAVIRSAGAFSSDFFSTSADQTVCDVLRYQACKNHGIHLYRSVRSTLSIRLSTILCLSYLSPVKGGRLKTRDLTSRDHWNCGGWHCETGQLGTISQGWTSRHLFHCASRSSIQVNICCREYYM